MTSKDIASAVLSESGDDKQTHRVFAESLRAVATAHDTSVMGFILASFSRQGELHWSGRCLTGQFLQLVAALIERLTYDPEFTREIMERISNKVIQPTDGVN